MRPVYAAFSREPMSFLRILIVATLGLAVSAAPAPAQRGRFALVPFGGYRKVSPIYEHTIRSSLPSTGDEAYRAQRLTISAVPLWGMRAEYAFARGWSASLEGTYGRGDYLVRDSTEASTLHNGKMHASAQVTWLRPEGSTLGLAFGVERAFELPSDLADELRLGAAASLLHFRLEELPLDCVRWSWTDPICERFEAPFEGAYDEWYRVPSLAGSVALRRDLVESRGVGIELRAECSLGRSAAGRVRDDRVVAPALYPVRTRVGSASASLGLVWRP